MLERYDSAFCSNLRCWDVRLLFRADSLSMIYVRSKSD